MTDQTTSACPIIDPLGTSSTAPVEPVPGLGDVGGAQVAVLDISKVRSDVFAGELARGLADDHGAQVRRGLAPGSQAMADDELRELGAACDGAVLALADCGTCSSWTLYDAIELHRHGCRAMLVTTTAQRPMVEAMVARLGLADLPLVEVAEPNRDQYADAITATARAATAAVAAALRG
ncbi:hypothetical protein FSW04_25295 [Baekduia soli]|uniref:UGSC-like domain-containing protein n=1 Tax=Baekduia soli TaxID=496014 RepID=A0A5B8UC00_9ACTN|nr:hypothetical protein [Baekduia soli]QEC50575.1 hypothetical protein FSW04_25295 [Baekduia soli]